MKKVIVVLAFLLLSVSIAFSAGPKTYQVNRSRS